MAEHTSTNTRQDWSIREAVGFRDSLIRNAKIFPDLPEKLAKFIEVKACDPLHGRYGKHDKRMTGPLSGFYNCHLKDDAVLIYKVKDRTIVLIYVAAHAELEGRRLANTARRLAS